MIIPYNYSIIKYPKSNSYLHNHQVNLSKPCHNMQIPSLRAAWGGEPPYLVA